MDITDLLFLFLLDILILHSDLSSFVCTVDSTIEILTSHQWLSLSTSLVTVNLSSLLPVYGLTLYLQAVSQSVVFDYLLIV